MRALSRRFSDSALLLVILLLIWELLYRVVGEIALTPPLATTFNAYVLLTSADFWPHVFTTFRALFLALIIEVIAGLFLGVVFGLNRLLGEVVEPVIVAFYSVPKIVFYPIVLMFCGIGIVSVVVFAIMHGILPILVFTMNAVRNVRPIFLKMARVMRLGFTETMWSIALPAAIPEVFTGLRIGFAATMLGVLLSEMFGSKSGLGFMLMNAIGLNQVNEITSLTLLLAGFAVSVNLVLLAVDKRLHRRI
ncbi:MAG: ABC transporter permease subunit [Proteobacteria bacterium]|nr:ABC transporter permease subunit [Pseudomonadota bacterium]